MTVLIPEVVMPKTKNDKGRGSKATLDRDEEEGFMELDIELTEDKIKQKVLTSEPIPHESLSKEAEVEVDNPPVGNMRERSFDSTQMYLKEIGFSPLLTAQEEIFYGRLAKKGDATARKKMIESNLRLVVKIA